MIIYSLFPTAVIKFELGRDLTSEELAFVAGQTTYKNVGNLTSNDRYVLKHWTLKNLNTFIEESVGEYLRSIYAPKNEVGLRITQSWINYCKPGEWHHHHKHPNSFISGVFYINAERERDKIHFHYDNHQQIKLPVSDFNIYNSESWWLEVGAGDLMIFPSSLTHSVEPVKEERISLSFNTFPVGYVGQEESLNALHLKD